MRATAPAKINLALVVGPTRPDGKHEVVTVLQRVDLCDTIELEPAADLSVEGFAEDTIVRRALEALAVAVGIEPRWRARIEKQIPVAAGLGGGSSDAATALRLANASLAEPLPAEQLHTIARTLGADVPFFLEPGPQLGTGDGSTLEPLELPQDYTVVLLLPTGVEKESTAAVYARFSAADGFAERSDQVLAVTQTASTPRDLAAFPRNDLVTSPFADELTALGAFRADVSGAGPVVYGLFDDRPAAERAAAELASRGRLWIATPAWYL
jgi:4-diphosphocytidyl-2-C-methyl-D-erythritol kinase